MLATGGMLLLVFALVKRPTRAGVPRGRSSSSPAPLVLLTAFVVNERRTRKPLLPLSIFRVNGLAAADATQLVAFAGLLAMFFFLTLYMQNVLGYSPIQTGAAYLPLSFGVGVSAGVSSQLVPRVGTRPVIVGGRAHQPGGRVLAVPHPGRRLLRLRPAAGNADRRRSASAPCSSPSRTAANAGVAADKAGLAAALLNASQQVGGALGLAIFTAIATSRTSDLLASDTAAPEALTVGIPAGAARVEPRSCWRQR